VAYACRFTDTPHPSTPTLSLHDALPISSNPCQVLKIKSGTPLSVNVGTSGSCSKRSFDAIANARSFPCCRNCMTLPVEGIDISRSEEHTSELQSRENLVCRLLLEKKKKQ